MELRRVLHPVVGAATAFDAVPAREFVNAEQVAVVEHEALRILVLPLSGLGLVRPRNDLRDWLYRLRAPGFDTDEGEPIFETDGGHATHEIGVAGFDEV